MSMLPGFPAKFPRVAITYCTKYKWMLRAAYFGQELLSSFDAALGEVALIPTSGGVFTVTLYMTALDDEGILIWDRKIENGFPDTEVLKRRVRDHVDPGRDLRDSWREGRDCSRPLSMDRERRRSTASKRQSQETSSARQSRDVSVFPPVSATSTSGFGLAEAGIGRRESRDAMPGAAMTSASHSASESRRESRDPFLPPSASTTTSMPVVDGGWRRSADVGSGARRSSTQQVGDE